ncbi:hypothetical protein [Flaviflexus massiliensis]|uniref:hypothetical protein n=1 Tax=Flaviflexus massiliensis TaxID=1522309 RepID=UPI0006D55495|nr:hypothetical protein [Flaviflexus massiliensis]
MVSLTKLGAVLACLSLLVACGDGEDHPEELTETVTEQETDATEPDKDGAEPTAEETDVTEPTDQATEEQTTESEQPSEEKLSTDNGSEAQDADGTFSATTLKGQTQLTIDVPEDWEVFGVEEAITDFDLITMMKGGTGDFPLESIILTDQDLGVDAATTMQSMYDSYAANSAVYQDLTMLDPITIDGVEFVGFDVISNTQVGTSRIQYWFADLEDTVLGAFVHYGSAEEPMPQHLTDLLHTLQIEPAK